MSKYHFRNFAKWGKMDDGPKGEGRPADFCQFYSDQSAPVWKIALNFSELSATLRFPLSRQSFLCSCLAAPVSCSFRVFLYISIRYVEPGKWVHSNNTASHNMSDSINIPAPRSDGWQPDPSCLSQTPSGTHYLAVTPGGKFRLVLNSTHP